MSGLRRAGQQIILPLGLLTRAWLRHLTGGRIGSESSQGDKHPDGTPRGPRDDLEAAEQLINDCGYHRRDEELADAKAAILGAG